MINYLYTSLIILFFVVPSEPVGGQIIKHNDPWIDSLPFPWTLTEDELSVMLNQFQEHYPEFNNRFEALLWWRVNTPYGAFKFGEEREPDTDPLIRMDSTDCTSHILCNLAISQSGSWEEARRNMVKIHYKSDPGYDPVPEYTLRWHYTLDRILHNNYTVNITDSLVTLDQVEKNKITLNRQEDGSEFLPLSWSQEVPLNFIPSELVNEALCESFPDLAGIAFVKRSYFRKGIAIAHEGVLLDGSTLIHASSDAGKTSAVDFLQYLHRDDGPLFDGIMVYRFVPFTQ